MSEETEYTFPIDYLSNFSTEVFIHFGVPEADARQAADVLAKSDLRGIDSHGVARLHTYFEMLELGRINPRPNIKIVREKASVGTVDGDNGLGLVVGPKANEMAMTKSTKLVAPLWGAERMLGTNPIAIAFPGYKEPPIVIDMATSAVAYGKI